MFLLVKIMESYMNVLKYGNINFQEKLIEYILKDI